MANSKMVEINNKYNKLRAEAGFAEVPGYEIIESRCSCGEPVSVEINGLYAARTDRKRPFYPGDSAVNATVVRCRKCHGWLGDTCPDAVFA